jgi:anti-sigma factor RsiW
MTHEEAVEKEAVERYQRGEMSQQEQAEFEAHYFDCEECGQAVIQVNAVVEEAARRKEEQMARRFNPGLVRTEPPLSRWAKFKKMLWWITHPHKHDQVGRGF